MNSPGVADRTADQNLRERAEKQAESLLERLKSEVKSSVKDLGVLRKELTVTVPGTVIREEISKNYEDMLGDVQLPGFRKGRAPRALVERRFSAEVRSTLKSSLIGQSFFAAAEKQELEVLGDPLFRVSKDGQEKLTELGEALRSIDLPESGDFSYVCELEVRPKFELPELKGIPIKSPQIEITDENVEEQILRQRKIHGRYEPVEQSGGDADDMLVADVKLTVDGQVVKTEENLQLGVRPTRLDGIALPELDKTLAGVKPGDVRSTECQVPDDYERADLRGKKGQFEFTVHEVKRLAPMDEEDFVRQIGAESGQQLREFARQDMERERDTLVARAKREQVLEYLLQNVPIDVPPELSARLTDRAVMRRVVEAQQRGIPWSEIERHIDELRTSAKGQVARDLKIEFIMGKVAEKLGVGVTEEEVNSEIAAIARRYDRRFDRVRDELHERGLLMQLAEQIRQDKCMDVLLADAQITEAKAELPKASKGKAKKAAAAAPEEGAEAAPAESEAKPAKPKRGKKSAE